MIYIYHALHDRETRVLVLDAGEFGTSLFGRLDVVSIADLQDEEQYEAISYTWGSLVHAHHLHVDGGEKLPLTVSQYEALQRFRLKDRKRRLWMDAICINQSQSALDERSSQVSIIADIFAAATRVLVWLGEANPSDALAFTVNNLDVGKWKSGREQEWLDEMDVYVSACGCCGQAAEAPFKPALSALRALGELLHRPWFTRLWTLQELAVQEDSVEICCGTHRMAYPQFREALNLWFDCEDAGLRLGGGPPISVIAELMSQVYFQMRLGSFGTKHDSFSASNMLEGIVRTSTRRCYDQRDRIFGMRRLLTVEHIEILRPDYTLPLGEVYRRAVVAALEEIRYQHGPPPQPLMLFNNHITLIFGLIGTEEPLSEDQASQGWPSWVPRFHELTQRSRMQVAEYRGKSRERFMFRLWPELPNQLDLRGLRFAVVDKIHEHSICPRTYGDARDAEAFWSNIIGPLIRWYFHCRLFISQYIDFDSLRPNEREELLSGNRSRGSDYAVSEEDFVEHLSASRELLAEGALEGQDIHQIYADLAPFLAYEMDFDMGRQLACVQMRSEKRIAWLPPRAMPGDHVFMLSGGRYPITVRERLDGYEVLGDAWVRDISFEYHAFGVSAEDWSKMTYDKSIPDRAERWQKWQEQKLEWISLV